MASRDFNLATDKIAFQKAVNKLAPYFGLPTTTDLSDSIALQRIFGIEGASTEQLGRPPEEIRNLVDMIINTTDGCLSVVTILQELSRLFSGPSVSQDLIRSYQNIVEICYEEVRAAREASVIQKLPHISQVIHTDLTDARTSIINRMPNNPSKENPGLCTFILKDVGVSPTARDMNALTIFLNGLPTLEMTRAVPFLNLKFLFGRGSLDSQNRLKAISLFKFLEGAKSVGSSGFQRMLVDVNTVIEGEGTETKEAATAGLELFTSPQTLVSADEIWNPRRRAVPVIDKFRPFLTIKSLTVDLSSAGAGLISYKTAKLEFVLHDRSRLHEIADFIKPDLYGTTEVELEYGWSHPDVPSDVRTQNAYGTLINGLRSKERYGIRNINFTFSDDGNVAITLDLYMKGGYECFSENIANTQGGVTDTLRQIERMATVISAYQRRFYPQSETSREIVGRQNLDAAADYQNNIRLSPELVRSFRRFETALNNGINGSSPVVREFLGALRRLHGNISSGGTQSTDTNDNLLIRLRTRIQDNIQNKLRGLGNENDPFLPDLAGFQSREQRFNTPGPRNARRTTNTGTAPTRELQNVLVNVDPSFRNSKVSLAKLLLLFVGEPLALTGKFSEIQFLFYKFNDYAGKANRLSIGNFVVDVPYFIQQYLRYRTENINRAANVNISDFLDFVSSIVVDDPASFSYGIYSLYRREHNRQTNEDTFSPLYPDGAIFQTKLEELLRDVTPDASFKMPVLGFHIESVPQKTNTEENAEVNPESNILRIHVFDKVATQYETQATLLDASRENALRTIGSIPVANTNGVVQRENANPSRRIMEVAEAENLIESIPTAEGLSGGRQVRIRGGIQKIKEFIMRTMPYVIYGVQGTAIRTVSVNSMQDPSLSTVNMLRSFRSGPLEANGEQPGGLPLSIIPVEVGMTTIGCPLFEFGQQMFVDFGTGTTMDQIYGITTVSHKLEPGSFSTEVKMVPIDAYGKYSSMIERVRQAATIISDLENRSRDENPGLSEDLEGL